MKSVSIYTTPNCQYCQEAKEFFKANDVEYKEIDVSGPNNVDMREQMIQLSGQMSVPVIKIDDKVFIGFDQAYIKDALGI